MASHQSVESSRQPNGLRRVVASLLIISGFASGVAQAQFVDHVSSFGPGIEGGAEISAYDAGSRHLFVTNSANNQLDVYQLNANGSVVSLPAIDLAPYGDGPNSVAAKDGLVAVAVQAAPAQAPGQVVFFSAADRAFVGQITVGALPDMLTFTADGQRVLVANEGEPNDDYSVDPEGSVSIIDLSAGVAAASVATVDFVAFNQGQPRHAELPEAVRIFGPGASVAQDLEPEYIALDDTGAVAYVSLQENNALAMIDIVNAEVLAIVALGYKDHLLAGNTLDSSDRDGAIRLQNWPVLGLYQPDTIASFSIAGQTYVLSANEGDARDYDGFSEEVRIRSLDLDPSRFPDAASLQLDENLGRLRATDQNGDDDQDGDFERLFIYGGRSFSVWDGQDGHLIWDSGDQFERATARFGLPFFNSDDNRSDDKGPEPEGLAVIHLDQHPYAVIGLERTGGFFLYDLAQPQQPRFVSYTPGQSGDISPEGVLAIPAGENGDQVPWLILTHEVSGTVAWYRLLPPASVPVLSPVGLTVLGLMMLFLSPLALERRRK